MRPKKEAEDSDRGIYNLSARESCKSGAKAQYMAVGRPNTSMIFNAELGGGGGIDVRLAYQFLGKPTEWQGPHSSLG